MQAITIKVSYKISKKMAICGTHPHADHIGGLDDVIDEFDIGEIYARVTHTTKTYMDVLEAIDEKGLRSRQPGQVDYTHRNGGDSGTGRLEIG